MTKYYDIYTQIPDIKPCPQKWITAEDKIDIIDQFLRKRDFIEIHDIVGTDVNELSCTDTILCKKEYFVCMVESRYEGAWSNHDMKVNIMNKEERIKQVAKTALNAAIVTSFFATMVSLIWLVWDQREVVSKVVATALIVFVAVWLFKLVWVVVKES